MDKKTRKILRDADWDILISDAYNNYGYKNNDEFTTKLKEMKEEGLIWFEECEDSPFKGYPKGKIRITELGKSKL